MSKVEFSTTAIAARGGVAAVLMQKLRGALQSAVNRSHFAFVRPAGSPGGTAAAMVMDSMTRCC